MLQADKDDIIYMKLDLCFPGISKVLSPENKDAMKRYGSMFRLYSAKANILRFVLRNLTEKGWLQAVKAMRYYKKNFIDG